MLRITCNYKLTKKKKKKIVIQRAYEYKDLYGTWLNLLAV